MWYGIRAENCCPIMTKEGTPMLFGSYREAVKCIENQLDNRLFDYEIVDVEVKIVQEGKK